MSSLIDNYEKIKKKLDIEFNKIKTDYEKLLSEFLKLKNENKKLQNENDKLKKQLKQKKEEIIKEEKEKYEKENQEKEKYEKENQEREKKLKELQKQNLDKQHLYLDKIKKLYENLKNNDFITNIEAVRCYYINNGVSKIDAEKYLKNYQNGLNISIIFNIIRYYYSINDWITDKEKQKIFNEYIDTFLEIFKKNLFNNDFTKYLFWFSHMNNNDPYKEKICEHIIHNINNEAYIENNKIYKAYEINIYDKYNKLYIYCSKFMKLNIKLNKCY